MPTLLIAALIAGAYLLVSDPQDLENQAVTVKLDKDTVYFRSLGQCETDIECVQLCVPSNIECDGGPQDK